MATNSQEDDLRVIAYHRSLVIEMIALAASGRTMMPKRDANRRLQAIIYSNRALQWLDDLEAIARYPPLRYLQRKVVKPTGVTLIDRVAQRTQREKNYALSHSHKEMAYQKDEDFYI